MWKGVLMTMAGTTNTVADPADEMPNDSTTGSSDVELEIDDEGLHVLEALVPGTPVEIRAKVEGGARHRAPGAAEDITAMRSYSELHCVGKSYGAAAIVEPGAGGPAPILKVGDVITICVGVSKG